MARDKLTGMPLLDEESRVEGASLNGGTAPDGSAERVRDYDPTKDPKVMASAKRLRDTIADSGGGYIEAGGERVVIPPSDETEPITVTDYDANGEAIDVPVEPPAPEMPGFTAPMLDLWGDYHGRRVSSMALSFSGTCDLNGLRADVREAAADIRLGHRVTVVVSGVLRKPNYDSEDERGPVAAALKLKVDDVMFTEPESEGAALRERIQAALTELGDFRLMAGGAGDESELDNASTLGYIDELIRILNGEAEAPSPEEIAAGLGADGFFDAADAEEERERGTDTRPAGFDTGTLEEALAEAQE